MCLVIWNWNCTFSVLQFKLLPEVTILSQLMHFVSSCKSCYTRTWIQYQTIALTSYTHWLHYYDYIYISAWLHYYDYMNYTIALGGGLPPDACHLSMSLGRKERTAGSEPSSRSSMYSSKSAESSIDRMYLIKQKKVHRYLKGTNHEFILL